MRFACCPQARADAAAATKATSSDLSQLQQQLTSTTQQLTAARAAQAEAERQVMQLQQELGAQARLAATLQQQCEREACAADRALALESRVQVSTAAHVAGLLGAWQGAAALSQDLGLSMA
jgi:chromosome segregation ATPase